MDKHSCQYAMRVGYVFYEYLYFYQPGACEAGEPAGPKITLRFPRLFVCLCVHTYHVRNTKSCVTMPLQSTTVLAAFGGLYAKILQASIDLCCLGGEKLVGSCDNPVFATYSC